MPLKTTGRSTPTDRSVLKELQEALKSDNAPLVLAQHSDADLLRLLEHQATWSFWRMVFLLIGGAFVVFYFGFVDSTIVPIVSLLLFISVFLLVQRARLKPEALRALQDRLRSASLPTLLDAYSLNIAVHQAVILEGIIKHLTLATADELEALGIWRRSQLVSFTLAQLRPHRLGTFDLSETQVQAATLGYLALATLKEPGAERPDRTWLTAKHSNLREAIVVYLTARRAVRSP